MRVAFIHTFPPPYREGKDPQTGHIPVWNPRKSWNGGRFRLRGVKLDPRSPKCTPILTPGLNPCKPLFRPALRDSVIRAGGATRPPLFILHLFLHPTSASRPAFCRSIALPQSGHTRVKRRRLWCPVLGCHSAPGSGTRSFAGATGRCFLPLPSLCFPSPNF